MKTKSTVKKPEKAVLIGVGLKIHSFEEMKESLAELEELCYSAGAEVVGTLVQSLQSFQPATLMGSGKVEEVKQMAEDTQATMVVVDHQLSGVQSRNLEKIWNCKVLDRAQLILDIFAQRASTYEGKLQVELAQMLDLMPRQVGAWLGSLSRQGGGIGTRGPGESAIEVDRRRVRDRVKIIKEKLEKVRKSRSQHRSLRQKHQIPSFALIGYTNSGKSTLLNALTHSDVLAKDQVFATLDPTTRKIFMEDFGDAVITDTVGFIRKLPTHLVEAFKATLEESAEADVLLHVVDLSSPSFQKQVEVVQGLIESFGWDNKPIIHIFNKVDQAPVNAKFQVKVYPKVFASALQKEGLDQLKREMIQAWQKLQGEEYELFFPKEDEHLIYDLGRESQILRSEPATQGTVCFVKLSPPQASRWQRFFV